MPKFIDYHAKLPPMPPEAMQQMLEMVKASKPDQLGVTPLNVFMGTGGQAYCLTDAPNADAVCKSHVAKGIALSIGDVVQVQSLV